MHLPRNPRCPAPKALHPMPSQEEWLDAGMGADEALGHPARRTPEEGIREMQARIELLTLRRNQLSRKPDAYELARLNSEICEAEARLAEYQTQLAGRN